MTEPRIGHPLRYWMERSLMRLLVRIVLRSGLQVTGLDRVPRTGPLIVVGNHIATCDPPLVGALLPRLDVHYMAKSESFRTMFQRFFMEGYNAFPVVRHSADRVALRRALRILAEGHALVMYPEGSRSPDHRMKRPHAGVGFIARRSGAPIVPAAIWGSENALPKGRFLPRNAEVHVVYGEPVHLPERNPDGSRMSHQQSADWMTARVAALLPEDYRGVFGRGGELAISTPPAA